MTPVAVARQVANLNRPLLIGLDVDGTLAPIVQDPAAAMIPTSTLRSLERLSVCEGVTLALISGRDCAALETMAPIANVWRAAEHGAIVLAPGETDTHSLRESPQAASLREFSGWAARNAPQAYLEIKPRSVALHVRQIAAGDSELAKQILHEACTEAARLQLPTRKGRAVLEVSLVNADKATALQEITRRTGSSGVFYAGDDLTDFGAIAFAAEHGMGVFVRSREQQPPPGASAILESTQDVAQVLAALAQEFR